MMMRKEEDEDGEGEDFDDEGEYIPAHIAAMLGIIRYLKRIKHPHLLCDRLLVLRMILCSIHPTPRNLRTLRPRLL